VPRGSRRPEESANSRYHLVPPGLRSRVRRAERLAGQPIVLRQVRTLDPAFKGRITRKPGYLLLEYQTAQSGYFWDIPIIEELLRRIEAGETDALLRED